MADIPDWFDIEIEDNVQIPQPPKYTCPIHGYIENAIMEFHAGFPESKKPEFTSRPFCILCIAQMADENLPVLTKHEESQDANR